MRLRQMRNDSDNMHICANICGYAHRFALMRMAIPSVHRQQQHNDTVNDGGVSGSDDTKDNPNNNLNNTTRNLNNVELMKVTQLMMTMTI